MTSVSSSRPGPASVVLSVTFASLLATVALAAMPASADGPRALREAYDRLKPVDATHGRRIEIESSEAGDSVEGTVSGVLAAPYATVRAALADPARWCDILMLHVNNKACRMEPRGTTAAITLKIATRYDEPVEKASAATFVYRLGESTPEILTVSLDAAQGPLWTHDHRIVLDAMPLDGGRTFLRLRYSYGYGMAARMAMDIYFATFGSGKVGFTETGPAGAAGAERHIGGVRGLMERNAMRYFLAVDAYLSESAAPEAERAENRLRRWFDSTELYPRQLHEVDRETYLRLKRQELAANDANR